MALQVAWEDFLKMSLIGRDLVEADGMTRSIFRGPISRIFLEGGMVRFERGWVAECRKGKLPWKLSKKGAPSLSPVARFAPTLEDGEFLIDVFGITLRILRMGDNLPRPES